MWSNVVEETGEPGENHRTWTGDHYPATCLDPDSNPDRRGDKRVRYPLRYPGPQFMIEARSRYCLMLQTQVKKKNVQNTHTHKRTYTCTHTLTHTQTHHISCILSICSKAKRENTFFILLFYDVNKKAYGISVL